MKTFVPIEVELVVLTERQWDLHAGPSHDDLWEPWADSGYDAKTRKGTVTVPDRVYMRPDAVTVMQHELRHVKLSALGDEDPTHHHHPWWHLCIAVPHPFRLFGWLFSAHSEHIWPGDGRVLLRGKRSTLVVEAPHG